MTIVRADVRALSGRDKDPALWIVRPVALERARFQFHLPAVRRAQSDLGIADRRLCETSMPLSDFERDTVTCGEGGAERLESRVRIHRHPKCGHRLNAAAIKFELRAIGERDGRQFADAVADKLHVLDEHAGGVNRETFAPVALNHHAGRADDPDGTVQNNATRVKSSRDLDGGARRSARDRRCEIEALRHDDVLVPTEWRRHDRRGGSSRRCPGTCGFGSLRRRRLDG